MSLPIHVEAASGNGYEKCSKTTRTYAECQLNDKKKRNTLFRLRKYEIKKEYIENEWDVSDDELVNAIFINDIKIFEDLEKELSRYLDDYSGLDVEWKCDNPI